MNWQCAVLQQVRKIWAKEDCCALKDLELLDRFVTNRDEAAFDVLLARHGPMVLGVCRRVLRDHQLIEDAFQATFLVLLRKAGSIGKRELLTNWLYGVAYRTASKSRVEMAKRRARESAVAPRQAADLLAEISARELIAVLDEELSGFPPRYRGPLVLCYLEGKTRDEVARQFGWSLATLARRLERGRDLLKARLTRRGLALPAVLPVMFYCGSASASVPPALAASTVAAATLAIGGATSTAAVISPNVIALTEGVLKTMFVTKLKTAIAVLLLAGMLGAAVGTTLVTSRTQAQPPAQNLTEAKEAPQTKGDEAAPKKGLEALWGKWSAVSIQGWQGDTPETLKIVSVDTKGLWMTLDRERMVRSTMGADGFKVTFEESKDPPRLTLHVKKGNEAWKIRYIFEVKGDTLRMCCFDLGNLDEAVAWPTKFSLDDDRENPKGPRLEIWKRVKDEPLSKDAKSIEALRGKWSAVSVETWSGNSNKNFKKTKREPKGEWMTIDGEKMVRSTTDADGFKVTFDHDKNLPRITWHITKGDEAWKMRFIYEVKGDTLRMCRFGVSEVNGVELVEWPATFSTEMDEKSPKFPMLEVWKRVKEEDAKESDIDAGPAWGEAVDGLQLAVTGIRQDRRFKAGDTIRYGLNVRNVGAQAVTIEYTLSLSNFWAPSQIETAKGDSVKILKTTFRGAPSLRTETLQPKGVASIRIAGILVVGASDAAEKHWPRIENPAPGEYRLRRGYQISRLDPKGKPIGEPIWLTSGTVTFRIDPAMNANESPVKHTAEVPPGENAARHIFDQFIAEGALAKDLMPPVKIQAAGKPIDVDVGHAAPFVADWNGDGTLHLLVGQFGDGKLRIYKNVGSKNEPRFGDFTWFKETVPTG